MGNVLTTISDRKIGVYSNGSLTLPNDSVYAVVDYYEPFMVSATDYYSFGIPSRKISAGDAGLTDYRYGFNGKENDNEVKGFGNKPIRFIDLDGLEEDVRGQNVPLMQQLRLKIVF